MDIISIKTVVKMSLIKDNINMLMFPISISKITFDHITELRDGYLEGMDIQLARFTYEQNCHYEDIGELYWPLYYRQDVANIMKSNVFSSLMCDKTIKYLNSVVTGNKVTIAELYKIKTNNSSHIFYDTARRFYRAIKKGEVSQFLDNSNDVILLLTKKTINENYFTSNDVIIAIKSILDDRFIKSSEVLVKKLMILLTLYFNNIISFFTNLLDDTYQYEDCEVDDNVRKMFNPGNISDFDNLIISMNLEDTLELYKKLIDYPTFWFLLEDIYNKDYPNYITLVKLAAISIICEPTVHSIKLYTYAWNAIRSLK